jgi:hypothetical protein
MTHIFELISFSAIHAGLFAAIQFLAKLSLYPGLQTHVLVYPPNTIYTVLLKQTSAGEKTLTHFLCMAFGLHLLLAVTKKLIILLKFQSQQNIITSSTSVVFLQNTTSTGSNVTIITITSRNTMSERRLKK